MSVREKEYPGRDSASFDALEVELVSSIDIKLASDDMSAEGDILVPRRLPRRLTNQKPRNDVTLPFFF